MLELFALKRLPRLSLPPDRSKDISALHILSRNLSCSNLLVLKYADHPVTHAVVDTRAGLSAVISIFSIDHSLGSSMRPTNIK